MTSVSWKARVVDGSLQLQAPKANGFTRGDTLGKSAFALEDAIQNGMNKTGARRKLYELQAATAQIQPVECPLQHSFIDGVYVRTIFIPAGTVIVGKIHKHSHANILSKGEVSVMTEEGGVQRLVGPLTMTSPAGCKRAVYAHTDTTWTTIHRTDETDLEKIEGYVIAPTYEDYERFKLAEGEAMKKIEVNK